MEFMSFFYSVKIKIEQSYQKINYDGKICANVMLTAANGANNNLSSKSLLTLAV